MGNSRSRTVAALLAVIAALVAGCGGDSDDGSGDSGDGAPAPRPADLTFIYVQATHTVLAQIPPAVAQFFSYDYRHLDQHNRQIRAASTASFWSQTEPSLKVVNDVAPRKQLVGSAQVVDSSLHLLQPARAELLLFVDLTATQAGGPPRRDGVSVLVTAARIGQVWKIDGMTVS
jgi:Mce-associated membrane protein